MIGFLFNKFNTEKQMLHRSNATCYGSEYIRTDTVSPQAVAFKSLPTAEYFCTSVLVWRIESLASLPCRITSWKSNILKPVVLSRAE